MHQQHANSTMGDEVVRTPTGKRPTKLARLRRNPTEIAVETCSKTSVGNSIVAGYCAGICGTLVGHPMDSAKVWLQTKSRHSKVSPNSLGPVTSWNVVSIQKSIRALYSGISGPLVTVGLIQCLNFAVYDSTRRILHGLDEPDHKGDLHYLNHDSINNVGVASATAGAAISFITSPIIMIKTQQQVYGFTMRQALGNAMGEQRSIRPLYVGFIPHLVSEIIGRVIYFGTYESLKRYLAARHENPVATTQDRMLSAAGAGMASWGLVFPLDSLRSRLFAMAGTTSNVRVYDMVRLMWREEGGSICSFYRGFGVTILRAGPVAAAVLPIYDACLEYLSSP